MFKIMHDDVLSDANPTILHWIEFVAGNSNDIILSRDKAVLAKAMLREAEQRVLVEGESLEKQSHIDRLRTALAPHKMVPTEILNIIFRHTSTLFCVCPFSEYTPLSLSHVCSRWRPILRSEPSFWNHALFGLSVMKDDLSHIKFWIDNFIVASHTLSLSVWTRPELDPEVYHLLIGSQHKLIRRLLIDQSEKFLAMPMHSFPLLEDLNITVFHKDLHAFEQSSCFLNMDNLHIFKVQFTVPIDEGTLTQAKVPWGRLTSLTVTFHQRDDSLTIAQAVELLKQCTKLTECTIQVTNSYTIIPLTVYLPNLSHLVFLPLRHDYDDVFSLTHCLIAPALKSLIIRVSMPKKYYPRPVPHVKPDIGTIIHHSGCFLHTLTLGHYSELSTDTDLELELLSSLRRLEAPRVVFSDETLQRVVDDILLPNIETLTLALRHIKTLEYLAKLVEMKSSSSNPVARHLHLTVEVVQPREAIMQEMAYISTCSKRVRACGSEMVLRCMDPDNPWSSECIDVCSDSCGEPILATTS